MNDYDVYIAYNDKKIDTIRSRDAGRAMDLAEIIYGRGVLYLVPVS